MQLDAQFHLDEPLPPQLPATRRPSEATSGRDWTFASRAGSDLERIHPYPAKFIPDIPAALLTDFPPAAGTAVLDPFVGSGTTLVECQKRGISSIGVDLNPIACLITQVKTSPCPVGLALEGEAAVSRARKLKKVVLPSIPNLDHWFEKSVQQAVARLLHAIGSAPAGHHPALQLALSSILVRVSNQDSDTRYAAVQKNHDEWSVYAAFAAACVRIESSLRSRSYDLASARVLQKNTLTLNRRDVSEKIGAVITSPPYPNAYEYWLYHKYRMWWLGHDPLAVKTDEIGARAHFFKTNGHTANHFVDQMRIAIGFIDKVLIPGGHASFVVGRSKIHGEIVDNSSIIERLGHERGFRTVLKDERTIAASRKSFNLAHANIKTETVLVLQRS